MILILFQKQSSDMVMSDSSEEEKGERGAASRSNLQKRASMLQASCQEDNYRQTVKAVKRDLHSLKEITHQRPKRGNVSQPSIPSPSPLKLPPTADSELPLPNSELPLPEDELPLPGGELPLPDSDSGMSSPPRPGKSSTNGKR